MENKFLQHQYPFSPSSREPVERLRFSNSHLKSSPNLDFSKCQESFGSCNGLPRQMARDSLLLFEKNYNLLNNFSSLLYETLVSERSFNYSSLLYDVFYINMVLCCCKHVAAAVLH